MIVSVMQYEEVFIIHTVAEIIKCNLSNEGYQAVHSCGAVCLLVYSVGLFSFPFRSVRIFVLFYSTAKFYYFLLQVDRPEFLGVWHTGFINQSQYITAKM